MDVTNAQNYFYEPPTDGTSRYLRLTEDELTLVMTAAKMPGIAGFQLPDDVTEASLLAAQNTLRARGGANLAPDGTLILDADMLTLIGTMARWGCLISVTLKFEGGKAEQHWIAMGHEATVLHSNTEAGIHQFQTIADGAALAQVLAGLLRIRLRNQSKPRSGRFTVEPQTLDEAEQKRQTAGSAACEQYLMEQGLPSLFARTSVMPTLNALVTVIAPTTGETDAQGQIRVNSYNMVVWGVPDDGGYFALLPGSEPPVDVVPMTGSQVIDQIADFVVDGTSVS
jgi:hypothetical protein